MPEENMQFRQRLRRAFSAANAAITPAFMVRASLQSFTIGGAVCVAMLITGLEPFVDAFIKTHSWLILKTCAVYIVFYPISFLLVRFTYAFLQGLFGLPDESD